MSEPKKIQSQTLKQFPGGTWNALVEGELRDRVPKKQLQQPAPSAPNSTVFIQLIWMGAADLPPGSVVSLTNPPSFFEDDPSVPFGVLRFKCEEPTTETVDGPFAITAAPIKTIAGSLPMGWGYIPNSCWAQVTINSADDDTAELVADETILSSTTGGRIPIVAKPSGTGIKWCVVQIASSGGGALILGQSTSTVSSATATFNIDNIFSVEGPDPRVDPESAAETREVKNSLKLTLTDNHWVFAKKNKAGDWETWADTGEGSEPGTGALFADFTATADSLRTADTITADIDQYWGGTPADLTAVTVNKLSDHDLTVFSGDKFRGVWDSENEQWKLLWFDGLRLTVKGTIAGTAVTAATSTFTLTTPSLANGWRLPASITVINDPPVYADVGATVYARFNLTVGTTPSTNWDTGDGGNFLPKLKGIGGWAAGGAIQFLVDEKDNDPEWVTPDSASSLGQALTHNASNDLVWMDYDVIEVNLV